MAKSRRTTRLPRSVPAASAPLPSPPRLGRLQWRRDGAICAGLLLLVALAYWPVVHNQFVSYDDDGYIVENEYVNSGLSLHGLHWAFTSIQREANWHPLTWISHMVDCQLFGLEPAGHHLANVGLHAINSILLYCLLLRMTRSVWPSAIVAAFFAVHPLHVESVAWAAERKDVLSTLFGLAAMGAWLSFIARPGAPGTPGRGRYLAVMLWYAASLMSKPMLVTLPLLLLLFDWWPLGRIMVGRRDSGSNRRGPLATTGSARPSHVPLSRLLLEKLPLVIMAAASCFVTMIAQSKGHAVVSLARHPISARLATVVQAYCGYLEKLFLPIHLAPIYPLAKSVNYLAVIVCGNILAVLTFLLVWAARRRNYLAAGWLWYLGMLVPVIGLVHVGQQSMADRYTYLPAVGIFILLAWSAAEAVARWQWLKGPLVGCAAGALAVCVLLSNAQVCRWASTKTLFTYTLAVTEKNPVALTNLGLVGIQEERYADAERDLQDALRLDPTEIDAWGNLASLYVKQKKYDAALAAYARLDHLCPNNAKCLCQMAKVLVEQGNPSQAENLLRRAVVLEPSSAMYHYYLAMNQQSLGRIDEAVENYAFVLRMHPHDLTALNNLAWIYATNSDACLRDGAKAVEMLEAAAQGKGSDANLLDTLAAAYAETGQFEKAEETADAAVRKARAEAAVPEAIAAMEKRLDLYKKRRPYHDRPAK